MGKVKIEGRVVIITGPKSTGKSRMCERLSQCYSNKGESSIITFHHVRHDNLTGLEEIFKTQRQIEECLQTDGKLAIINTDDVVYEALKGLLVALKVMGYKGKITILKTDLSEELHHDYWQRSRNRSRIKWSRIKKERVAFEKILNDDKFDDSRVVSIRIKNPGETKFDV